MVLRCHAPLQNAALRQEVVGLFERYQKYMDAELQQRAVEYLVRSMQLLKGTQGCACIRQLNLL
jgi:hypothetical protein